MKTINMTAGNSNTEVYYLNVDTEVVEYHYPNKNYRFEPTHKLILARAFTQDEINLIFRTIFRTLEAQDNDEPIHIL
jgi:hypothetical protein